MSTIVRICGSSHPKTKNPVPARYTAKPVNQAYREADFCERHVMNLMGFIRNVGPCVVSEVENG